MMARWLLILIALAILPTAFGLNICNQDLRLTVTIDGNQYDATYNGNGEYLVNGMTITINTCLNCLETTNCDAINQTLWSCSSTRCDQAWNICTNSLSTANSNLTQCNNKYATCSHDLSIEFNESEYYQSKYEECVAQKRQYLKCGSNKDEDCKVLWEDCADDLKNYKKVADDAVSDLTSCGTRSNQNCKTLWEQCDDNLETCYSSRDSFEKEASSYSSKYNECVTQRDDYKAERDDYQSQLSACQTIQSSQSGNIIQAQAPQQCMNCNQVLESFKQSIGWNETLGNVPCKASSCENGSFKSCLIAWILAIAMTVIALIIVVANILNLSNERRKQQPPQLPPQQQMGGGEGAFDMF